MLRKWLLTYPVLAIGLLVAVGGTALAVDGAKFVVHTEGVTGGIVTTVVPTVVDAFHEGQNASGGAPAAPNASPSPH